MTTDAFVAYRTAFVRLWHFSEVALTPGYVRLEMRIGQPTLRDPSATQGRARIALGLVTSPSHGASSRPGGDEAQDREGPN